ncbi:MAG: hypothetical protein V3R99_13510, partial [Thermoguttaceae bacterium]
VELHSGDSLLIGKHGMEFKDEDGGPYSLFVLLRATKVVSYRRASDFYTKIYSVADLVVPTPDKIVTSSGQVETRDKRAEIRRQFRSLIELIMHRIRPTTWIDAGGCGEISPYVTNLSLVVSQSPEVHEEIVDLLEQLKRQQGIQVSLSAEIVHLPQEMVERVGIDLNPQKGRTTLTPREARMFRAFVAGSPKKTDIRCLAKVALVNGQQAEVSVPPQPKGGKESGRLLIQTITSKDQRNVWLYAVVSGNDLSAPVASHTADIPDGHSLLYDVTDQWPMADYPEMRTFLLTTPTIVVVEEEEERIGIFPPGTHS